MAGVEFVLRWYDIHTHHTQVTRAVDYGKELCFDYFKRDQSDDESSDETSEYPFLVDYNRPKNVRKKVTLDAMEMDAAARTRVSNFSAEARPRFFSSDHNTPWDEDHRSLVFKDVCTVFVNGEFINSDIVHRACSHLRHVAGAQERVHIVNTNYLPCLMYEDPFMDCTMEANETKIKDYLKEYPKSSWTGHLDAGRIVFVPLNYPKGEHWCCVVLWKGTSQHYVRVYNSMAKYRKFDKKAADTCAHVCAFMDPEYKNIKWRFYNPHDQIEQRPRLHRCALHVVSRAWQVCKNEHLNRVMTLTTYDRITAFVRKEFLDRATTLCGEGIIPNEKLV